METVQLSQSPTLSDLEFEESVINRIVYKIKNLRNHHHLRGDLDLLHFVCNCIEAEEKKYSIDQRKLHRLRVSNQNKLKSIFSFSSRENKFPDKYFGSDVKKEMARVILRMIHGDFTSEELKNINKQLEYLYNKNMVVRPTSYQLWVNGWWNYFYPKSSYKTLSEEEEEIQGSINFKKRNSVSAKNEL